jgi:hypothetical protein
MTRLALVRKAPEEAHAQPSLAFGERSGGHLIYRPRSPRDTLRVVQREEEVEPCPNP